MNLPPDRARAPVRPTPTGDADIDGSRRRRTDLGHWAAAGIRARTIRRVVVYGVTGSGKSVAAARIAATTGIPYVDVDALMWEPGWVQVAQAEQRARMEEVCSGDAWVLDTAYGSWTDLALARADLVIGLDYPRSVSLRRLLRRTVRRLRLGTEVCNGNVETLVRVLGSESIVRWHFRSYRSKRERILAWERSSAVPPVLVLRRPRQLSAWLASLAPVPRGDV